MVWTRLSDPDPNFVPPPTPKPPHSAKRGKQPRADGRSEDQEAYEAGRSLAETLKAIDEAEQVIERAIRDGRPQGDRQH